MLLLLLLAKLLQVQLQVQLPLATLPLLLCRDSLLVTLLQVQLPLVTLLLLLCRDSLFTMLLPLLSLHLRIQVKSMLPSRTRRNRRTLHIPIQLNRILFKGTRGWFIQA
jgi:hypothetical protein